MADITLRAVKGSPLTIEELDTNFINMNNDIGNKVSNSSYTAADVLNKIKSVDGHGSGLDADVLDGYQPSLLASNNTIPIRNNSGTIVSTSFTGNLTGNVTGNVSGNLIGNVQGNVVGDCTGNSSNVTGIVVVANGGTGSSTPANARLNLGAASSGTNSDITSITGLTTPLSTTQGGTGTTTATGTGSTVLSDSPVLTGYPNAPTQSGGDNSTKIATTGFVQMTGYNSQGRKIVSNTAPSTTTGYNNGDIWYQY